MSRCTFAVAAEIILCQGFFSEKAFQETMKTHRRFVSREAQRHVSEVIECDRLTPASAASHLRHQLSTKEIYHDRVVTQFVIRPPLLALCWLTFVRSEWRFAWRCLLRAIDKVPTFCQRVISLRPYIREGWQAAPGRLAGSIRETGTGDFLEPVWAQKEFSFCSMTLHRRWKQALRTALQHDH